MEGVASADVAIHGQFETNVAGAGGGVYQDSAKVLRLQNAGLEGDTAQLGGQGVYSANQLELGPSIQAPDGFFILNRNTLPSITAHLTSDSVVQLEGSDYVAPNPAGTPILVARSDLTLTAEDAAVFRAPVPDFDGWGPQLSEDGHQVVLALLEYTLQYENTLGAENPNPLSYTALTAAITLANLADTADYCFTGWPLRAANG